MGSIRLTSVTDAPKIGFTLENCVNTQKSKVEWAKKLKLTERLFQKRVWFLKYFVKISECISKICRICTLITWFMCRIGEFLRGWENDRFQ